MTKYEDLAFDLCPALSPEHRAEFRKAVILALGEEGDLDYRYDPESIQKEGIGEFFENILTKSAKHLAEFDKGTWMFWAAADRGQHKALKSLFKYCKELRWENIQ